MPPFYLLIAPLGPSIFYPVERMCGPVDVYSGERERERERIVRERERNTERGPSYLKVLFSLNMEILLSVEGERKRDRGKIPFAISFLLPLEAEERERELGWKWNLVTFAVKYQPPKEEKTQFRFLFFISPGIPVVS